MKFFLIFAFPLLLQITEAKQLFHAVTVSTLPAPLILDAEKSHAGLITDYLTALADELKIDLKIELLPRKRIDKKNEVYDLNCYSSKAWNDNPDSFHWTQPLFIKKEIIAGSRPVPDSLNGFNGEIIGTMRGYKYPALDKLFETKKLIRNDAENETLNFQKLVKNRISFIVTDEMLLSYFLKNNPEATKIILPKYLIESTFPVQCAIKKESTLSVKAVDKAIQKLKQSGKLEEIFNNYR